LAYQRLRYLQRLSGPILDRIDLFVCVEEIDHRQLLKASSKDSSQAVQRRVQKAYQIQQVRSGQLNAGLDNAAVRRWCKLSVSTKATLDKLASQTHLSARVYMKTVKVARTIADLADCQQIKLEHVLEALRLRQEASYGA
jgi:magnesium chelatase family protein